MANTFVWYDLMTTDRKAAAAFYVDVIGWTIEESPGPVPYTLFKLGDRQVAGLMDVPARAEGMPPQWFGYIGTKDVDAKAKAVVAAGAKLLVGPRRHSRRGPLRSDQRSPRR